MITVIEKLTKEINKKFTEEKIKKPIFIFKKSNFTTTQINAK